MRDAQADVPLAEWLRAQLAFKNSMIHGILQFTPSIAFCYVLHRCESLDIRCRESYWLRFRCQPDPPRNPRGKGAIRLSSPWRFPRRELGLVRGPGGMGFPVHARRPTFFVNLFAVVRAGFDNDPSAGSPTETLLRLLLPLNDKVQWTSFDVAGGEPLTSPQSEHFTGPFNR